MEVEATRRWLDQRLTGRAIVELDLVDRRLWKCGDPELAGRRVLGVRRRAKWLWLQLDQGGLAVHLRMTGRFASQPDGKLRATLSTEDGHVHFLDTRCFAEWHHVDALEQVLGRLGPEPWPGVQPAAWWQERMHGLRGAIKPAFMKQDRIAGLGNIAAIELCWLAELDPTTRVPSVGAATWTRVGEACHDHLTRALADALRDGMRYLNDGGGDHDNPFYVYRREGQPCPRCSGLIERFVQAGRGTFWCPGCQV